MGLVVSSRSSPSPTRTLATVLLGAFAANVTLTILTIALHPIARAFHADVGDAAWITLAPIVVSALVAPTAGQAADSLGRKRMWTLGLTLELVGIGLSAAAWSLPVLIGARIVSGIGSALALPAGAALVLSHYEPARRSIPLGWWTSTMALSPAAGVLIGGLVVEHLSWRWLFLGQIPMIAVAIVLGLALFREQRVAKTAPFDSAGAALGGVVIFGLLIAVNRGTVWGWTSPAILACVTLAAVAVPLFCAVERRAPRPVLPIALLRDPIVRWSVLNRALLSSAYMGSFIVLPVWLIELRDYSPAIVALALAPRPIAMGLAGPVAGILSERANPIALVMVGSIAVTLPIVYLAAMPVAAPYAILFVALVIKGTGLALAGTATGALVAARTHVDELGTVSGFLGIVGSIANSLGMALMISLVAMAGGEHTASAYRWSFGVGAALAGTSVAAALALSRTRGALDHAGRIDGMTSRPFLR
jgi:MFS family permease